MTAKLTQALDEVVQELLVEELPVDVGCATPAVVAVVDVEELIDVEDVVVDELVVDGDVIVGDAVVVDEKLDDVL